MEPSANLAIVRMCCFVTGWGFEYIYKMYVYTYTVTYNGYIVYTGNIESEVVDDVLYMLLQYFGHCRRFLYICSLLFMFILTVTLGVLYRYMYFPEYSPCVYRFEFHTH